MKQQMTPFQPGDKVVAYCRYSEGDDQGNKNTSTEEQEHAIREYCVQHKLTLVHVFADPFASGRSVAKREHYLEMMSMLTKKRKPDIQGVILWDYERYGRNYDRAQYDAAQLRMKGYKLFSMQQPIVDSSPFAHVLESMYFASAQNQSDMISADVRRALQSNFTKHRCIPRTNIPVGWIPVKVKMGYYRDGSERFGYRAEPDPVYKERIRNAVTMRLQGRRVAEIRDYLSGKFKTCAMVNTLFEKTLLYGAMTYGGTLMENYCEPIIDKETYERLQVYIASEPKRRRSPGGGVYAKDRALLSGLLVCGICGERMHMDRRKAKGHIYETYYCNSYHIGVRKESIDDLVIDAAIDLLSGEKWQQSQDLLVEEIVKDWKAENNDAVTKMDIEVIEKKIMNLTEAIAAAEIAPKALVTKIAELELQRDAMKEVVQDGISEEKIRAMTDKLRYKIRAVLESETATTDEKREALQAFIYEIVVLPGCKLAIKHGLPGYSQVAGKPRGGQKRPSKITFTLATYLTYQRHPKRSN